jgi:hypothetical protein
VVRVGFCFDAGAEGGTDAYNQKQGPICLLSFRFTVLHSCYDGHMLARLNPDPGNFGCRNGFYFIYFAFFC